MLAHRKAQSRRGDDGSPSADSLDEEGEEEKKEKERIKEIAKKRILNYRKKMREQKLKEMEEDVKKRKAIRDKFRERVKQKRLKEIDAAAAAIHMNTTRSMSGYNPLTLHSPTHINSHKHTLNWGVEAHKTFDQMLQQPPPPPPQTTAAAAKEEKNNNNANTSTTEYEKVQKRFSRLYEVKTPRQDGRKSTTKSAEERKRTGSIESLSSPRDSRTGSELKRLSLVEITPLNSKRASLDMNADDITIESSLNDTIKVKPNSSCFEHALVMGVSEQTVRAAVEAGDWGVYDPVTLTSFPPDKPLALEALADFVFPAGVQFTKVGRKNLTSSPKFGTNSTPSDERRVKNIQEMVLLFDTTATDYDEGDSEDDISLSDEEENLGPRIKTSTLYGIAVTFTVTMAIKVKSSSSWSSSGGLKTIMVEVPRGILLLSRNSCLPVHFDALHHAANNYGWTDEPGFQIPPDPPAPPLGSSSPPPSKVQRGFSNFFSSQSGGTSGARASGSFNSQNATDFNTNDTTNGNPFDDTAADFGSVPSFGPYATKNDSSLFDFLTRYQDVCMPTQSNQLAEFALTTSKSIYYRLPPAEPELNLPAPISDTDMILEWALPVLLQLLSLEDLTMVLGCAMCEMQCVFVCDNVSQLSAAVTAVVGLLRPLKWACPIIVTLPTSLHIYLESPVPVFLGVTSLPPNHVPPPGQVLVHLGKRQKDRVQLSEEDMAKYIDHVMPGSSELAYNLNKDYMRLKNLDSPVKIDGNRGLSPPLDASVSQDVLLGMRNIVRICKDQVEWLVSNAGKEKGELLKGLGQGREAGMAFMRRLTFTQMYSAYTFDLKIEQRRAAKRALNPDAYTPYNDGDDDGDESVGAGEEREALNPKRMVRRRTTAIAMDNFNSRNSAMGEDLQPAFTSPNRGEGGASAQAPAVVGIVEKVKEKDGERAEKRYSSKALKKKAAAMGVGMNFEDSHTSKKTWKDIERGRVEMLFEMILGGEVWAYESKAKHDKAEEEVGEEEKKSDDTIPAVLWCNGMCNGRVDTPQCTMLCVGIWEENEVKNMFEEGGRRVKKKKKKKALDLEEMGGRRRGASFLQPAGVVGMGMEMPDVSYNAPLSPKRAPSEKEKVLGTMRMSQAGYIVKGLMQRRVEKGKRVKAAGVIGRLLKKTLIARVKKDRLQRGVVKMQSFARKKKAYKTAGEKTMRKIRMDMDDHLVEKLDSGRKAAKDIDWLFRETDSEIKDIAGVVKTAEQRGRTLTTEINDEDIEWLFKDGVGAEISGGRRRGSSGVGGGGRRDSAGSRSRLGSVDSAASDRDVNWLFKSTSTLREAEEVVEEATKVVEKKTKNNITPIIPIDFNKEGIIDGEWIKKELDKEEFKGLSRRQSSLEDFEEQENEVKEEMEVEAEAEAEAEEARVVEKKRERVVVKRISLDEDGKGKIIGKIEEEEKEGEEEEEEEEQDSSSEEEKERVKEVKLEEKVEEEDSSEEDEEEPPVVEKAKETVAAAPQSDFNASFGTFGSKQTKEEDAGFSASFDDSGLDDNGFNEEETNQQSDNAFSASFDDAAFGRFDEQPNIGFGDELTSFGNFGSGFRDEPTEEPKARAKPVPTELPALEDTEDEEVDAKVDDDSSVEDEEEEEEEVYTTSDEEKEEEEEKPPQTQEDSSSEEETETRSIEDEGNDSSVEESNRLQKEVQAATFDDDFGNFDAPPETSVTTSAGFDDFDDSAFGGFETETVTPKTEKGGSNFEADFDTPAFDTPAFETSPPFETTPFETTPFKTTPFETTPFETTPFETTPFGNEEKKEEKEEEDSSSEDSSSEDSSSEEEEEEQEKEQQQQNPAAVQRPSLMTRQNTLSNVSNFPAFEDMAKGFEKEEIEEDEDDEEEEEEFDDAFETSPFPDDNDNAAFDDAAFDNAPFGDDDAFSPTPTAFAMTKTTPTGGVDETTISFAKPPAANVAAVSAGFDDFGDDDFGNFDKDPKVSDVVTFKATEVGADMDDQSSSSSDGFDPSDILSSPEEFDNTQSSGRTVKRSSRHDTFEFDESEVDERFSSAALSFDKEDPGFDPNAKPSPRSSPPKSKSPSPPQPKSRRSPSSPPPAPDTPAVPMPSPSATQSFPSRLSSGFLLRKHNRRGPPKFVVLYSTDGQTLKWRSPSTAEQATGNLEENGKRGNKIKKSKIKLKDVKEIRTDGGTKVMQKSIKNKLCNGGQGGLMLISLVLSDRTLDLEVGKEEEYECLRVGMARLCDL
ncbi:hypothetical protein TL16_g12012 [Triparma laevis f. inornata]|uniref:cDENN domain-containing protein n=1 Tax=Triparma laevis f. inornata TaxID=1714386 RepID=A0A9W7BPZ5_9STRA|nr:hypothetical protein TL16_g12012 [Triparma laevis f. inornata]